MWCQTPQNPDAGGGSGVGGGDGGGDAAADVPVGGDGHAAGGEGGDEVVEDAVGDVLVEVPLVPEAPQVQLERLELDDALVGHVGEHHGGEVGLARHRAQARELGGLAPHLVVATRVRV